MKPLCATTPTPGRVSRGACRQGLEGDRDAGGQVAEPHAVRPDQQDAGLARGVGQRVLPGLAFVARLGVARGEQDRRVAVSRCQALDRLQHARLGNGQHRQVDALRQFLDRPYAGAAADLGTAATDEVQLALVAEALQIGLHEPAEGTRIGRGADDGDGTRLKDAVEGQGRHIGIGGDSAHAVKPL
jgi:hypothetical protein